MSASHFAINWRGATLRGGASSGIYQIFDDRVVVRAIHSRIVVAFTGDGNSGGMGRTGTASRVIEAPLARVFAALVDPHALVEWLPPQGMTGRFDHFDARAGGSYRMTLTYAHAH